MSGIRAGESGWTLPEESKAQGITGKKAPGVIIFAMVKVLSPQEVGEVPIPSVAANFVEKSLEIDKVELKVKSKLGSKKFGIIVEFEP